MSPKPGPGSSSIRPARYRKAQVPRIYTWIAPVHDLLARVVEAKARRLALSWAAVKDGEAVLEVGVGTGLSFQEVLRQNPHGCNEGLDLTPAMLRRAARRAARSGTNRYHLRLGDAYHLPYPDDTFDLLLNSYMFDLLPVEDFPLVLSEFLRVLRPGGRLVMINMTRGERWYHHLWEGLYQLHPFLLGGCRGVLVAPSLQQVGFQQVRRQYVSQSGFPSEVLYAEKKPLA